MDRASRHIYHDHALAIHTPPRTHTKKRSQAEERRSRMDRSSRLRDLISKPQSWTSQDG